MTTQDLDRRLHPACEIGPDNRPKRLVLPLGGGAETSVYLFRSGRSARRGAVLYVHGIQSHAGWYVGSAMALARAGLDVYLVNRRGSGDNAADRGHASSAGQLLDDIDAARRFVLDRSGWASLHLLGVSWGGKLLAAYAACRPAERCESLTLVAPGIVPQVNVPLRAKLGVAACLLLRPRRRFAIPLDRVELFTDNPAMRDYLRGDPLSLHQATARLLYASRRLDRMLARAAAGAIVMPTRLILAGRDRIIDNPATRAAVERLTANRAEVTQLDGCHSLEFEPDPSPLYEALVQSVTRATG